MTSFRWSIGEKGQELAPDARTAADATSMYDKLERVVVSDFYHHRDRFIDIMRQAIALNGSFFIAIGWWKNT
jgi:starch phosphorylase